jgi:hypothetical protein
MSTEQNKAVVRRFFEEAFEQGNLAVVDEIIAPNSVNGGPSTMPGIPSGPEGAKILITTIATFLTFTSRSTNRSPKAIRWSRWSARNGALAGIPPTGSQGRQVRRPN